MTAPIFFKPIYQERVWGARNLSEALGRELPEGKVIGEAWEVVDRPEAQSVVCEGEFAGKSIRELIAANADQIMGDGYDPQRPFPILVKWLDCADRLSLQVHPPASVAPELNGEPKTENWYIADCKENASLIVGLKKGATRDEFEKRLQDNTLEECIHRFPVKPGDSILVESGRLHAIDAGNLILEIQQNSDTTYRVYDWGRVGLDGKPRQLHIEQSLKSIEWNDFEPSAMQSDGEEVVLADCKEFRLVKYTLQGGKPVRLPAGQPRLLSPVEGEVSANGVTVSRGDNVLLAADTEWEISGAAGAAFLVTERFV